MSFQIACSCSPRADDIARGRCETMGLFDKDKGRIGKIEFVLLIYLPLCGLGPSAEKTPQQGGNHHLLLPLIHFVQLQHRAAPRPEEFGQVEMLKIIEDDRVIQHALQPPDKRIGRARVAIVALTILSATFSQLPQANPQIVPGIEPSVPGMPSSPSSAPALPAPPSLGIGRVAKGRDKKMTRKARAEFIAKRSKCLKPLEAKIKSLEDEIISSEARVAEANGELMEESRKGGLGALRRSEFSREFRELAKKIELCYAQLETTMKAYDAEKRKYSDE